VRVEEGRFAVLLEEPGTFHVAVQRRDGSRAAVAEPVVFESASKEIIIRLGDARIPGVVENADGTPAANVRVSARRSGETRATAEAQGRSDSSGRFSLDELTAGSWTLTAGNDGGQSAGVVVDALPGRTADGIRLVLRELHALRAKVVLADGTPAAHAALLVRDDALGQGGLTAMTDARGEFELLHPTALDGVAANVFVRLGDGRGFAKRLPLRDGMTLTASRTGTVVLRRTDGPWRRDTVMDHVLVGEDRSWVQPLNVGRAEGDRLTVALAPGVWRYVVLSGPEQSRLLRSGGGTTLPAVRTFVVQESAVLEVQIDVGAQ
jgi:Carboxypeptidase regulatory-like domain